MSIFLSPSALDAMRKHYVGKRVRLLRTSDPYTRLTTGAEGTADFVDDAGTVFVKWDDGSSLGLVRGEDMFEVVA